MTELDTVQIGGLGVDYVAEGPVDGPAVLLIHGLGWDAARLWSGVMPALAEAGFRALAPNLRGVGGTDATEAVYTTALYAADMNGFLDALDVACAAVVGFSMGASIAAALASETDKATALCLACGGLHSTDAGREGVEAMLARAETLGPAAFAAEQAEAIFHPDWAAANPEAVADFKVWRAAMDHGALFRAFRSGYGVDYREAVRSAGLPTQVIAADEDAFCELADMRAMAASIPGARFDVVRECGHMATVERLPEFNATLLDFLLSLGDRP